MVDNVPMSASSCSFERMILHHRGGVGIVGIQPRRYLHLRVGRRELSNVLVNEFLEVQLGRCRGILAELDLEFDKEDLEFSKSVHLGTFDVEIRPDACFQFSNPYAKVDVQVKHVEEGVKLNQSVHASDKGCPNLPFSNEASRRPPSMTARLQRVKYTPPLTVRRVGRFPPNPRRGTTG